MSTSGSTDKGVRKSTDRISRSVLLIERRGSETRNSTRLIITVRRSAPGCNPAAADGKMSLSTEADRDPSASQSSGPRARDFFIAQGERTDHRHRATMASRNP